MEEMNGLNKNTPEFPKINKENPFRVPDDYFENFSARLQKRMDAERVELVKKDNRTIRLLKPIMSIAASLLLVFLLVYWPVKTFLPEKEAELTDTFSENIDNEYLAMIEHIDENSFYSLLEEQTNTNDLNEEEMANFISNNVSDYEIYLATDN